MRQIYITDRRACSDLLDCMVRAADSGVDFIQIREKGLTGRELLYLVDSAVRCLTRWPVKVLVNSRIDVALAVGAHGAHLPSDSVPAEAWRRIVPAGFLIGQSCHSADEVRAASAVDFVLYGPVFSTPGKGPATGLDSLRSIAEIATVPVYALGGITRENAESCVSAGAAGIAAIRMFQESR
jgi:thiamine-phosphate pyrophosphorylase